MMPRSSPLIAPVIEGPYWKTQNVVRKVAIGFTKINVILVFAGQECPVLMGLMSLSPEDSMCDWTEPRKQHRTQPRSS
jgi:hypothetical protein